MYKIVVNYNALAKSENYDSIENAEVAAQKLLAEPDYDTPEAYSGLEQPHEVLIVEVRKAFTKKIEYTEEEH
jgi:hypothetical protein